MTTPTPNTPSDARAATDPRYHTENLAGMLRVAADHARADVTKIDDPKAQALLETSAEVLTGLVTAFEHYEQRAEPAWR